MNRIRKKIQVDKYGILRGNLVVGLLLILCVFAFSRVLLHYDRTEEEERALSAVRQVSGKFEQMVEDGLMQLGSAASLLNDGVDEKTVLENLSSNSVFDDVGVVFDGVIRRTDGSERAVGEESAYLHYDATSGSAKVIAQADGAIQLRVALKNQGELTGWLDTDEVDTILRSAFSEGYGYAVYNSSTGAYLINRTQFPEGGYYDALMALQSDGSIEKLLNAGVGEVHFRDDEADDFYIAQASSGVRPWNIALIIPEGLVRGSAAIHSLMPYILIATLLGLLAVLAAYTVHALRRVHLANKNVVRALDVGERMLSRVAMEAQSTLFVHRRGQDGSSLCYDGLGLLGSAADGGKLVTLTELTNACGLAEEESERLQENMRDLEAGQNVQLMLHSSVQDREEHVLRFALSCPADDAEVIILSIQDCTLKLLSQDRANEERSYRASMETKASSIWQINVSRNRWRLVYVKNPATLRTLNVKKDVWRDYSADLNGMLRDRVHPEDYDASFESMSLISISDLYRSGRTRFVQDYRVRKAKGDGFKWHRMTVHLCLDPDSGDVMADLYVLNVDAEKNAEMERGERTRILKQTLTALSGIYYGLYYVDLEKDLCYTAKSHGGELVSELCAPYKESFDRYISENVQVEDQAALHELLDSYQLRRNMTEGSHYRRKKFHRRSGDGFVWSAITVQPARFENGTVREVVIALSNVEPT